MSVPVIYETNLTDMFIRPVLHFNETQELSFIVNNGSGLMNQGYVSALCRVENMDLLIQMQLAQTIFEFLILVLVSFYVTLYVLRGWE